MNNNQLKAIGVSVSLMALSFVFHIFDVQDFGGIIVVTRRYIWEQIAVVALVGVFAVYFLRTKKKPKK